MENREELTPKEREELLRNFQNRFEKHMNRHEGFKWKEVKDRLNSNSSVVKLKSLYEMERTGGEPDIVGQEKAMGELIFLRLLS